MSVETGPILNSLVSRWRICLVGAIAALIPGLAMAADLADKPADSSGWIVTIGGMAFYGPQYIGAKKFGPSGSPVFGLRRPGDKQGFSSPDDSLDYSFYDSDQLRFGVVGNLRQGRSTQNDPRLAGLSNFPWVIEAGLFTELWPVPDVFRTRIEIRHGLKGGDGFTMDMSADGVRKVGAFTLSGGPRLSMADGTVMNQQFGVTALESLQNSRVHPFRAGSGVRSVGAAFSVDYDWSEQWKTTLYQRFDRLVGDAAVSPVTRELGSKSQYTVGLGLTYSFRLSGF